MRASLGGDGVVDEVQDAAIQHDVASFDEAGPRVAAAAAVP